MRTANAATLSRQIISATQTAARRADKDKNGVLSRSEIATIPARQRDSIELYRTQGFGVWDSAPANGVVRIPELITAFRRHVGREIGSGKVSSENIGLVDSDLRPEAREFLKTKGRGRDLSIGEIVGARRKMNAQSDRFADAVVSLYRDVGNMVGSYDDEADLRAQAKRLFSTSRLTEVTPEHNAAYELRLDSAPGFHEESSFSVLLDSKLNIVALTFADEEVRAVKRGNRAWRDLSNEN